MNAMLLFAQVFDRPREPRSEAYRQGAWAAMQRVATHDTSRPAPCPYGAGTAERDAWLAGYDEGRREARAAEVSE